MGRKFLEPMLFYACQISSSKKYFSIDGANPKLALSWTVPLNTGSILHLVRSPSYRRKTLFATGNACLKSSPQVYPLSFTDTPSRRFLMSKNAWHFGESHCVMSHACFNSDSQKKGLSSPLRCFEAPHFGQNTRASKAVRASFDQGYVLSVSVTRDTSPQSRPGPHAIRRL